ncbi:hypothetical protein [Peribacillus loiseleuriae]|uniref:Uncharacterized protein n=1 Tax=Peribacillus loiseleuriae TaxID=1679170 RepID=A0A0K9GUS9_9BACI|nr:hypothetical protein [Peribacillus loiseleuriae]KMY50388.1 hypothetical protein AC625_13485 [Peribacillus loiseleuriae]
MGLVKSIGSYVMLGIGIAGVSMVSTKRNRGKVVNVYSKMRTKALKLWEKQQSEVDHLLEKAGQPNPYDIDGSRMIDEGSMTGIQYYNRKQ